MKLNKKRKGFTLIELVVVIAILGILLVILVPNVMGAKSKAENLAYDIAIKRLNEAAVLFTIDFPNTKIKWATHDGGTKAIQGKEITKANLDEAWYLYLDEFPKNPKNLITTFVVEISEDGVINIYDRGY